MPKTILKNATFIDWRTLLLNQTNIIVDEGIDGKLSFKDHFNDIILSEDDQVIDCKDKFVTKSFAVGHHHAYSALSRGMPAPTQPINNFVDKLRYIWWKMDKVLDSDMVLACALSTAIACAKSGSTFAIDHHASPNFIMGSLEIIASAFDKVGVSHLLCYEITDRDGLGKAQLGLDETREYLRNRQGLVGLHASFTVGDETLRNAVRLMQDTDSGIHMHVAEDLFDQKFCADTYNMTVVQRLSQFGVLDSPKTILAHCLHISDEERNLIGKAPAYVVQNTESNLNNAVGYFNSKDLGNNIMIGTDGMHSDIIRSSQSAFFVGQGNDQIDFLNAYYRTRKVHNYISSNNFKGDGDNNLVVFNYDTPTEINNDNFLGHFIFGLLSKHVQHVLSNGKLIVKDGEMQTVKEEEVFLFTKEQATRLWEKL